MKSQNYGNHEGTGRVQAENRSGQMKTGLR